MGREEWSEGELVEGVEDLLDFGAGAVVEWPSIQRSTCSASRIATVSILNLVVALTLARPDLRRASNDV